MSFQRDLLAKKLRDPQAKILSDLIRIQHNESQETTNYITSNLKGYALKAQDRVRESDRYYANVKSADLTNNYYTGKYPDYDNLRLYLLVENGDKLHDYSMFQNESYVLSDSQIQEIYVREEPNNISNHEVVSYFTGSQYVIVKDNKRLSLSEIITNEPSKVGFTIVRRLNLLKAGDSKQVSNILMQKVDSSSNRYGYTINVDEQGSIYFYVKYNYRQYFVKLPNAFDIDTIPANFFQDNFNIKNYRTEAEVITQFIEELFDVACSFNFSTKEAKIQLRYKETTLLSASSLTQLPANLRIHLPFQDGEWSDFESVRIGNINDITSNSLHGVITNPTSGIWDDDNTFRNDKNASAGVDVECPSNTTLNSISEFTLCFWYKPYSLLDLSSRLFFKGSDTTPNFRLQREAASSDLTLSISLTGTGAVEGSVTKPGCFPEMNRWYFVTAKWKTGEKPTLSIDNSTASIGNNIVTGTISTTLPFKILDFRTDDSTIVNVMLFSRRISTTEQTTVYDLGPHLSQFPKNKPAQISADPTPDPVTNPFTILYDLPKITAPTINDYLFINDPSSANPYVSKYNCADGTPSSVPKVSVYNIADGTIVPGADTRGTFQIASTDTTSIVLGGTTTTATTSIVSNDEDWTKIGDPTRVSTQVTQHPVSITSSDESFGILGIDAGENQKLAVGLLDSSDSTTVAGELVIGPVKSAKFYFRGANTPTGIVYCRIWNSVGSIRATLDSWSIPNPGDLAESGWTAHTFLSPSNTVVMVEGDKIGVEYVAPNSNDQILVRRRSTSLLASVTLAFHDGNTWDTTPNYELASDFIYETSAQTTTTDVNTGSKTGIKITSTTSGMGQALNGKPIKSATFTLSKDAGSTGTLTCKIWNDLNVVVATIQSIDVANVSSTAWGTHTFTNNSNTVNMANNFTIGLEYTSIGEGSVVYMKRRSTSSDASVVQNFYYTGWVTNSTYEPACSFTYVTSSTGNKIAALNITSTSSGGGQTLNGKAITQAIFYIRNVNGATGTLYCKIYETSGAEIKTLGSYNVANLSTTSMTGVTFPNSSNTTTMSLERAIGIEYQGTGTMQIEVAVRNANTDPSLNIEYQSGGVWNSNNTQEMKCDFAWGSLVPDKDPRYQLYYQNYQIIAETIASTSALVGKAITEQTFKMKRSSTATGTLTWKIWNSSGTEKKNYGITVDLNTISTTTDTVVTFTDLNNTTALNGGDRIGVVWNSQPQNAAAILYVMSNSGNAGSSNNLDSTSSYISLFDNAIGWANDVNSDLAGTMSTGGSSFSANIQYSQSVKAVYEKCVNSNSSFYNQMLTQTKIRAKRTGTIPAPSTMACVVRNSSNNQQTVIGTIDANSIPTTGFTDTFFTNAASPYVLSSGDFVAFELGTCDAANYIQVNINNDVVDLGNSVLGVNTNGVAQDQAQYDLAGTFYVGGQLDNVSRNRVGQFINTQNSLFIKATNNRITYVQFTFVKVGAPSGQVFINIRRGVDDSNIKTIGQFGASSITTALTGTTIPLTDVTNTYIMEAKDIISIEYSGGDQNNKIGVQVRSVTPNYDGVDSYVSRFNGAVYDYNTALDIVGTMKVGGDTYTPDPNAKPPNMPQSSTDLYIGVRGDKVGIYEKSIVSSVLFTTEILTDTQLNNLYNTRLDIEDNLSNEVLVTNYAFIKDI